MVQMVKVRKGICDMEMYVGLTDYDLFTFQVEQKYDEVNFWKPGIKKEFKALQPNSLFLFKLKKPYDAIVGGAYYVGYSQMSCDSAWDIFLEKNGVKNKQELVERAHKYKEEHHMDLDDMRIGCIVLTEPFFFEKKDWINPINDWAPQIVQGKKYDTTVGEGKRVYKEVIKRLNFYTDSRYNKSMVIPKVKYYETTTKHRIGQGAFRVMVTDAYARRCAISGERALPVLQAAHIRAFSKDGLNEVNNGILLRSDIHTLFDRGYITISTDYKVMVGNRLKQDFGFCQNYYNYQDKTIYLPQNKTYYPLKEYLQWHMENVFKIRNNL